VNRKKTKFVGVYVQESSVAKLHTGKPDGTFYITYRHDQRKVWEKVGRRSEGYTAAMANEIRSERLRSLRHGDLPPAARKRAAISLNQAWQLYDERHLYQVKGVATDRARYRLLIEPTLGELPLDSIKPLDVEGLKADLIKSGRSSQTVRHALSLLHRVYRKMTAWGVYSGKIPTAEVTLPKVDNARTRWLTHDEAHLLLGELKQRSPQMYAVAFVALHTGMRAGEILSLQAGQVELESGIIHIMDAKAGSRTAYITPSLKTLLESILPDSPAALLFPARNGKQSPAVSKTFMRAVDAVGLNAGITDNRHKVVFHTLRHTFGSWLAMAGVPLYVIAELMGHSTIAMTERYSHLCPDAKRQAVRTIENIFIAGHKSASFEPASMLQHPFEDKE